MPKRSRALLQLPTTTATSLEKLGLHLAVARLRRRESLRTWAKRMGVTTATLQRLEGGDPTVSMGVYATALWLIQRDHALGQIALPENDAGTIEQDVRAAMELGRKRSKAVAEARLTVQIRKKGGEQP